MRARETTGAPIAATVAVQHELRRRLRLHLCDESGMTPSGTAIYSLADPRDVRAARLWLPDEMPWWVEVPRLQPLYGWIRDLYYGEGRLPMMIVHSWVEAAHAQLAERERIRLCLERQLPVLNVAICHLDAADEPERT